MPMINDVMNAEEVKPEIKAETKIEPKLEVNGIINTEVIEQPKSETKAEIVKKLKKKEKSENVVEQKRPPLEQITDDYEEIILNHEISGHKLVKLGYKCGKIIYGIKAVDKGKDFRCIAYKARKKSKSVNGKSRGIFYFGINQLKSKELVKEHNEIKISVFGKCSVQSQTPIELVLDRVTFTKKFGKDQDKVFKLLKILTKATCESKKEQYHLLQTKLKEKSEVKEKKTK